MRHRIPLLWRRATASVALVAALLWAVPAAAQIVPGGITAGGRFPASATLTSLTLSGSTSELTINASTTLDNATGNEVAYKLAYTTNKASSGNDTGLLISMTDTASPGTSYPLDIQVEASSVFSIDNSGTIRTTATANIGTLVIQSNAVITAEATNVLAQRNGASAQTQRGYYNYNSAADYSRWALSTSSKGITLAAEAGTGGASWTNADITLTPKGTGQVLVTSTFPLAATYLRVFSSGTTGPYLQAAGTSDLIRFNSAVGAGAGIQLSEMTAPSSPAADTARIYAEDNGAGKTRLCVLFSSGAAQCFATQP